MRRNLADDRVWLSIGAALVLLVVTSGMPSPQLRPAETQDEFRQTQAGKVQPDSAGPQSFEVASIKPSSGDGRMVQIGVSPGGRWTARGVTAKMLIQQAYNVRDFQITGGPGWLSSDGYDIVAKAETPNISREQMGPLLQSLLAERFKLQFHRETRELPQYALVVGKGEPKMHLSEIQPELDSRGLPKEPPAAGAAGPRKGAMIRMGRGQLNAQMASISVFAQMLAQQLGRPVVDKTGLKGFYDFELQWTPDENERGMGLGIGDGRESPPPIDSSGPSIFTALQEQLGLRLEGAKGPVPIVVIDRIEKPTGN